VSTAVGPAAVAETHSAVVVFVGDRAYSPPDVAAGIRRRAAVGGDPCDATPEMVDRVAAPFGSDHVAGTRRQHLDPRLSRRQAERRAGGDDIRGGRVR
jgi:hypothetical protein